MNKIKAIIFDMDGVLIDARDWHYEALNKALSLFGMAISHSDHLVQFDGLPTKVKLDLLTNEKGLPKGLHGLINDLKQQYTMEISFEKCKPVYAHRYALSKLAMDGFRLAVCSNSIKSTVSLLLEKASLKQYLNFFLSSEDVNNPKPSPEIYLKAFLLLDLDPSECLVLEDNDNGIRAAQESGAHVLKIKNPKDVTYENIRAKIQNIEGSL